MARRPIGTRTSPPQQPPIGVVQNSTNRHHHTNNHRGRTHTRARATASRQCPLSLSFLYTNYAQTDLAVTLVSEPTYVQKKAARITRYRRQFRRQRYRRLAEGRCSTRVRRRTVAGWYWWTVVAVGRPERPQHLLRLESLPDVASIGATTNEAKPISFLQKAFSSGDIMKPKTGMPKACSRAT